jgi:hypothetical protein
MFLMAASRRAYSCFKALLISISCRSICERVQAVSDETRKRQDKWRCTAKHQKNLACDTQHRPLVRDLQ